jgi:hypothetical protein
MQHFKVHYSIRGGPDFIHSTGPGRIKAGFYSLVFEKKKLAGARFYVCKGRAEPWAGPCFIHNRLFYSLSRFELFFMHFFESNMG